MAGCISPAKPEFKALRRVIFFMGGWLLSTVAIRAEPTQNPTLTTSIERHFTTNALDSDRAVADWYTLLRGGLQKEWGDADATVSLGGEVRASRHDTQTIEDDRTVTLSASAFRRLRRGLELRGTLTYRASSEGDDLSIGQTTLGTRTNKQTFGASTQLGFDLGKSTTLILEASDTFEKIGATRFHADLLPATQLDPDRNLMHTSVRLTKTEGGIAYGVSGSALLAKVDDLGDPPVALSFQHYALRGELVLTTTDESTLAAALGVDYLGDNEGLFAQGRPAWQLAIIKKFSHSLEMHGSWFGRYETSDSDDPLASWLERADIELSMKLEDRLALSAGLFREKKENLLFENVERSHGLYAEATYDLSQQAALTVRVDASKTVKSVIDVEERTLDTFVALRTKL